MTWMKWSGAVYEGDPSTAMMAGRYMPHMTQPQPIRPQKLPKSKGFTAAVDGVSIVSVSFSRVSNTGVRSKVALGHFIAVFISNISRSRDPHSLMLSIVITDMLLWLPWPYC
ncbi:hypothetical protein SK128_026728 [Halocaridina rubra]|uniref:Uncharacterized protein n=1 Tax=Halocaridina rubra TaxID=373956 RepID=A0AAN8XMU1_HALRR